MDILIQARLFKGPKDAQRSERALIVLLRALLFLNEDYLREHPDTPNLYDSGVRYKREHGTEHWKAVPQLLRDKHGDCEDLACWRAAEQRISGIECRPFLKRMVRNGFRLYHVLVQYPDGRIEDPSKKLGMGKDDDA